MAWRACRWAACGVSSGMEDKTTFVPLRRAASALGVPLSWLRLEAEAGRVPAVRAGRRWLVALERAQQLLQERAERGDGGAS